MCQWNYRGNTRLQPGDSATRKMGFSPDRILGTTQTWFPFLHIPILRMTLYCAHAPLKRRGLRAQYEPASPSSSASNNCSINALTQSRN